MLYLTCNFVNVLSTPPIRCPGAGEEWGRKTNEVARGVGRGKWWRKGKSRNWEREDAEDRGKQGGEEEGVRGWRVRGKKGEGEKGRGRRRRGMEMRWLERELGRLAENGREGRRRTEKRRGDGRRGERQPLSSTHSLCLDSPFGGRKINYPHLHPLSNGKLSNGNLLTSTS